MEEGVAREFSMTPGLVPELELRSHEGKVAQYCKKSRPPKQRKGRLVQSAAFALAIIMVVGAGLGVFSILTKSPNKEKVISTTPMFMIHSPILIESEAALTVANGVTGGDGTPGNPFVIQGWDIDASGSTIAGIVVSNITSDLVIRNVNVHSGGSNNAGIALLNVTNCEVEDSQSTDNVVGIGVIMADHAMIQNNRVENNVNEGILMFYSNYSLVTHNIAVNSPGIGIALINSIGSSVENNTMTDNDAAGLALEFCDQTTVSGNMMDGSSVGLLQVMTNWSLIHDNKIEGSLDQGIEMMLCYNNTVFLNIIANTIGGQMFTGYGAFMMSSANNTFYHNDFMHNYASPQVIDDSDMDHWNPSYPTGGNHWTDYSGSDTQSGPNQNIPGSDGIGDTPYEIDDSISPSPIFDHYPLMATLTHENGPTAFFTVTPASGPASTNFTFNASLSWDPDIYTGALEVRWDFNGDSAWDTGWSTQMIVQHTYTQAGEYNVTMEVRNGTGSTNTMTWHVEVDQVVIPEFTTLLVPICAMTALFLVLRGLGRRR